MKKQKQVVEFVGIVASAETKAEAKQKCIEQAEHNIAGSYDPIFVTYHGWSALAWRVPSTYATEVHSESLWNYTVAEPGKAINPNRVTCCMGGTREAVTRAMLFNIGQQDWDTTDTEFADMPSETVRKELQHYARLYQQAYGTRKAA